MPLEYFLREEENAAQKYQEGREGPPLDDLVERNCTSDEEHCFTPTRQSQESKDSRVGRERGGGGGIK